MKMVLGIGIDVIEVSRIREAAERHQGFLSRVFTDKEIKYCSRYKNRWQHFAGRFAAKEAIAKALGRSLRWQSIEILEAEGSPPIIAISKEAKQTLKPNDNIIISISHSKDYAIAVAIWEQR